MWSSLLFFVFYSTILCITESSAQIQVTCTSPHEKYGCGSACDTECHRLNERCPIVNIKCVDRCYCDQGYARNGNNICVPIDNCADACGPNEVIKLNKKSCPPETCFSLVAKFKCDSRQKGKPGCACKDGYLRKDINSPCMPLHQCPELAHSPDFN